MTKTMECPLCGSSVLRTEEFENKINSYMKQQDEAERTKKELQFHINTLKAQVLEAKGNKNEIEALAQKKASKEAEAKIKVIKEQANLSIAKEAEKIANKTILQFETKIKKDNKEKLQKERDKLIELGISKSKNEFEEYRLQKDKESKAKEIKLARYEKEVEELNKKLKAGKDVELKGEAQEDLIEEFIKKQFPNCDVEPVGKGALGDDVHVIVHDVRKKVGTIGVESKDTLNYSSKWVEKLKDDMTRNNLDFAVIVSTSVPKNFTGVKWEFGGRIAIIKMSYFSLNLIIATLIQAVIHLNNSKKINSLSETKQAELYERLTSSSLPMKIRSLVDSFTKEAEIIDKDSSYFEKSRGQRLKNLEQKKTQIRRIFSDMAGGDEKISSTLLIDADVEESNIVKIENIKEEVIN